MINSMNELEVKVFTDQHLVYRSNFMERYGLDHEEHQIVIIFEHPTLENVRIRILDKSTFIITRKVSNRLQDGVKCKIEYNSIVHNIRDIEVAIDALLVVGYTKIFKGIKHRWVYKPIKIYDVELTYDVWTSIEKFKDYDVEEIKKILPISFFEVEATSNSVDVLQVSRDIFDNQIITVDQGTIPMITQLLDTSDFTKFACHNILSK